MRMHDLPDARGHFGPYGGVFVAETLTHALEQLLAAYAEARVYVRADLDVAYQHVVRVVETLQLARFRKVAILAQRADDG